MSSIAYVTDVKMLEYHRLCANRKILFWRFSSNKKFTDFEKGDLLFFFAKSRFSSRKGLVGYAHYDSSMKLSTNKMWKDYQNLTGYDTKEQLEETIIRASRNHELPPTLSCLYLTDVVFFNSPVYPKDVGITIPAKLESYQYLDKDDPEITVRILKKASEAGIDVWSSDPNADPDEIFHKDELRQQLAMVNKEVGPFHFTSSELSKAKKLAQAKVKEGNFEAIQRSVTDVIRLEKKDVIIGLPFVYNSQDREQRIQEFLGRVSLYKYGLKKCGVSKRISFEILSEEPCEDLKGVLSEEGEQ